jgi:hypothetical protein
MLVVLNKALRSFFKGNEVKKITFVITFTFLLVAMPILLFNVKPAMGIWTGIIYIRASGEVDPVTPRFSTDMAPTDCVFARAHQR